MKLRYDRTYRWQGHRVRVQDGAKVRRISDRGTLDARAVDVQTVGGTLGADGLPLKFSVLVRELEETE